MRTRRKSRAGGSITGWGSIRTRVLTLSGLAVVVLLAACAGRGTLGESTVTTGSDTGKAMKVTYNSVSEGGENGGTPQTLEVIAQGDRFRMAISDAASPGDVYQTVVWDGKDMLLLEGEDASREQDPPADQRPTSYFLRVGDSTFRIVCPGGARKGTATVAGRPGTVYTCPAQGAGDTAVPASEMTLDDETGLLLRRDGEGSHMEAVAVTPNVTVDAETFSTEIPAGLRGPEDATDDSGNPLPLTAVESIPKAGGGELQLDEIRHGPSLVVIGELDGVTHMLGRVLPKTASGTAPRVYVLLNPISYSEDEPDNSDLSMATEEGTKKLLARVSAQVMKFPVPVGIDIKGGAAGEDLRPFEELMAGTTVLAAIDKDGALAWRMTDDELAASPAQLDTWITSHS
jgi:hypothetical protein